MAGRHGMPPWHAATAGRHGRPGVVFAIENDVASALLAAT
jgi:hypothetical protein